jgi:tRNA modification GTPase
LFNALVGREGAIVSPLAGTTRDYLVAKLQCGERTCCLVDTAGVDLDADQTVEREAQDASGQQLVDAAVEVFCLDATRSINEWESAALLQIGAPPRIVVLTKSDMPAAEQAPEEFSAKVNVLRTSSRTEQGLVELRGRIAMELAERTSAGSVVAATAVRSRDAVRQASVALASALEAATQQRGEELVASEIRAALDALGVVVGAVYTDELLDGIFLQFCIGK